MALSIFLVWPYHSYMINQPRNEYEETLVRKGYALSEIRQTPSRYQRKFPLTIHGRTFFTQEEYDNAIHEFLNGN